MVAMVVANCESKRSDSGFGRNFSKFLGYLFSCCNANRIVFL